MTPPTFFAIEDRLDEIADEALGLGPLERLASEQLGRTVTVGSLDFKPWSLELTLRDIAVAGAKGSETGPAQLTIGRVYVDAELQSLLRLAPVVDAVAVDAPVLHLTHTGKGQYDIALTSFKLFLIQYPDSSLAPNAHFWMAECYFRTRDYERGIEEYEQELKRREGIAP